jgi:hypothetical protein
MLTTQFYHCLEKAEESVITGILNDTFIPRLREQGLVSSGSCRRKSNAALKHLDYDCQLETLSRGPLSVEIEAKNDWVKSSNACFELLGRADFRGLPEVLQPRSLVKVSKGTPLHTLALEEVEDRLRNGLREKDSWGCILDPALPPNHWFFMRRRTKGYATVYRTNRVAKALRPLLREFDLCFGEPQDAYYPFRSICLLVPEDWLKANAGGLIQDVFNC